MKIMLLNKPCALCASIGRREPIASAAGSLHQGAEHLSSCSVLITPIVVCNDEAQSSANVCFCKGSGSSTAPEIFRQDF